ncbi:UNVERIFIED_CONTAM: hypothetical protein FKN15_000727 [Acipenser sinensis]
MIETVLAGLCPLISQPLLSESSCSMLGSVSTIDCTGKLKKVAAGSCCYENTDAAYVTCIYSVAGSD